MRDMQINISDQVFKTLFSGVYRDKIQAVIRELGANARDSVVKAGTNRPIKVKFAIKGNRYQVTNFSVQDYGLGMTEEEVASLIGTFYSSTKRGDDTQIGHFGIGAKTPFILSDTFYIHAVKDGVKSMTMFHRDKGIPFLYSISNESTEEPNGVRVDIPLTNNAGQNPYKYEDFHKLFLFYALYPCGFEVEYEFEDLNPAQIEIFRQTAQKAAEVLYEDDNGYVVQVYNHNSIWASRERLVSVGGNLTRVNSGYGHFSNIARVLNPGTTTTGIVYIHKVPFDENYLDEGREQISETYVRNIVGSRDYSNNSPVLHWLIQRTNCSNITLNAHGIEDCALGYCPPNLEVDCLELTSVLGSACRNLGVVYVNPSIKKLSNINRILVVSLNRAPYRITFHDELVKAFAGGDREAYSLILAVNRKSDFESSLKHRIPNSWDRIEFKSIRDVVRETPSLETYLHRNGFKSWLSYLNTNKGGKSSTSTRTKYKLLLTTEEGEVEEFYGYKTNIKALIKEKLRGTYRLLCKDEIESEQELRDFVVNWKEYCKRVEAHPSGRLVFLPELTHKDAIGLEVGFDSLHRLGGNRLFCDPIEISKPYVIPLVRHILDEDENLIDRAVALKHATAFSGIHSVDIQRFILMKGKGFEPMNYRTNSPLSFDPSKEVDVLYDIIVNLPPLIQQ